jgi:competence protein ComEC
MTMSSSELVDEQPRGEHTSGVVGALRWCGRQAVAERERWILWVPVLLGLGISAYFALKREPPAWSGALALVGACLLLVLVRRWFVAALVVAGVAFVCLGFAATQLRVGLVAAATMDQEISSDTVRGRVCEVGLLPSGYRVHMDRLAIADLPPAETPERIRLRIAGPTATVRPGEWVEVSARLGPISEPLAPGAFDFQRHVFFERIGAVGFAFGAPRPIAPPTDTGWAAQLTCRLSALRLAIAQRIRAALPGDTGAIGAALITGDQGAISKPVLQDMRDSGLAHLLSISGLHIGLVAGILFVSVRRLLCLFQRIALHYPIKKWGAIAALIGTLFYVVLAGAPVPTVRSFIMAGMLLLAVVLDRTAISMPPVAWAAIVVLLVCPEELIGPSFQMSFAAVVALVAAYESTQTWRLRLRAESGWPGRFAFYLGGLVLTSLIATIATAPYSIFHFNRLASYGVIANMIAVPLTGLWIMPWAVAAAALMPFGLEAWALVPMGWGIDAVRAIAAGIAGWPGAVWLVPTLPVGGLALITVGGLWLCLWQQRWRFMGLPLIACGFATIALVRAPVVLVAGDGWLFAVADADGRLLLSSTRANEFVVDTWLRRAGTKVSEPLNADAAGADGRLTCDSLGCLYRLHGRTIALVRQPVALSEDCAAADVVVSFEPVRIPCRTGTAVIDRFDLWRNGAHAIWIDEDGVIDIESVRDRRGDRPWVIGRPNP